MLTKNKVFSLFFILSIGFIILLQQSPNLYALHNTPQGYFFTGQASWFDPWDINVYVGAIKQGQMGQVLLQNAYTTDAHSAALFYPVYTLVGFLFRSLNPFVIFHLFAIFTSICLFIILYRLSRFFMKDKRYALFTTVLTTVGGGIGWLFYPAVQSADLGITGFTFHSAFQRPHEALGMILYLSSLSYFYKYVQIHIRRNALISLFSMLFLILFYPYYLVSYALICGSFIYFSIDSEKKQSQYVTLGINILIIAIITAFYFFHLLSTGFSSVVAQSLSHPTLFSLVLGYGVFLPLFIYQFQLLKYKHTERLFLVIWILISLGLSFFLAGIGRFYLRGLFFPLSILFIFTIRKSKSRIIRSAFMFIIICFVAGSSSLYVWYRRIEETNRINSWFYQSEELKDVFNILESAPKKGVLAGYLTGNILPPQSGKNVYFGHYIQTPHADEKIERLSIFYGSKIATAEARQFLISNNIHYVVYGAEEKKLGRLNYPFLAPIYRSDNIELYEVK